MSRSLFLYMKIHFVFWYLLEGHAVFFHFKLIVFYESQIDFQAKCYIFIIYPIIVLIVELS